MILKPYKLVGEPTSFKGIKGPFLFLALYYTGGFLFIILVVFMLPLNQFIQIAAIGIMIVLWLIKMNTFKTKSKGKDIHIMNKNRCRKPIHIKGEI